MTTQYSLSDVLPKDATGLPFQAPVDIGTSQLDFALQAGIAASTTSGKRYAYMGVGTQKQSDTIAVTSPGVAILGYTGSPLSVTSNLQFLWLNRNGAVNITPSDSYTILSSGSTAASAETAHSLFGNYGGLSDVAASVVLYTEVLAQSNDALLYPSVSTAGRGVVLSASQTDYKELKPMQRTNASALHIRNKTAANNTTVNWFIYRKDA
jgi:hypothetical protein